MKTDRRHYRSSERHRVVGRVNVDVSIGDVADAVAAASRSWLSPVVLIVGSDKTAHIHAQGMASAERAIRANTAAVVGTYDTAAYNRSGVQRVRQRVVSDLSNHIARQP